jgi:hypothetical protein
VNYQRALTPDPVTVSLRGVLCTLDATGTLVDAQGATGLWLATGAYSVVFTLKGMRILPTTIVVTEEHTELEPLDLAIAIPPEGPPIGAGQYAELSQRIENVEIAAGVPDHGTLTGLADDDHPQYAKSDGTRGAFATVAQGVLAATAVQPAELTVALSGYALAGHNHTGVYATAAQGAKADTAVQPAALSAYALTSHNHDGTYATAAQGTKADSAVQPATLSGYATTAALNTGLSGKANTSHTHAAGDVTSGAFALARLGGGTPAAGKYVDGGTGNWTDLPAGGGGGVTDHGALTGLGDDDHTQYAKADGTRGSFATTAQGTKADSASQPGHAHSGADITTGTVVAARLPAATSTASGIVELATTAETTTGTDTTRAVTAAGVKAVADTKAATSHTHTASQVSDSTTTGRAVLTAVDAAAARTALSLGTAATTASSAYATAAQGAKADSAVQSSDASVLDIVNVTQAEYDALSPPVATTLYVVTP